RRPFACLLGLRAAARDGAQSPAYAGIGRRGCGGSTARGSTMRKGLLQLNNVSKVFDTITAVDCVSFTLAEGEFLSLLGPSGSGKTTTLQMIAGLMHPNSGEILLSGAPMGPLPPYRRNIGMVFQNYALFPHLTVERNIAFPLEMRRMR